MSVNESITEVDSLFEEYLVDIENNDLLVTELYSKERSRRVEFYGIQLDELWSFVGKKSNKQWLRLALNPINRQIIAFHIGGRSAEDVQLFSKVVQAFFLIIGKPM